jgi:hypothetical protein
LNPGSDPVPFWPLDPGPGWGKNLDPDRASGKNIPDHISENLNFFMRIWTGTGIRDLLDPGSEIRDGKIWIRDPE